MNPWLIVFLLYQSTYIHLICRIDLKLLSSLAKIVGHVKKVKVGWLFIAVEGHQQDSCFLKDFGYITYLSPNSPRKPAIHCQLTSLIPRSPAHWLYCLGNDIRYTEEISNYYSNKSIASALHRLFIFIWWQPDLSAAVRVTPVSQGLAFCWSWISPTLEPQKVKLHGLYAGDFQMWMCVRELI